MGKFNNDISNNFHSESGCFRFDIREISVVLADHNRIAPSRLSTIVVRGLRSIREHERFDKYSYNNDIAILEMDSPVDFTTTVQPACLPRGGKYTGCLI